MIEAHGLTKRYGDKTAVDDATFTVSPGAVTGFLGPNGAGKSTTLRVVVGLTPPDHGTAHVLGRRFRDMPNPGTEVGVLLDASAQHAGRTGREVLGIAQTTMGLPRRRVTEVLDVVGLSEAEATRRLRDYSLGMRQRLGLAHALLGDPEVLILDEPANGLDPEGVRWIRQLLSGLADEGRVAECLRLEPRATGFRLSARLDLDALGLRRARLGQEQPERHRNRHLAAGHGEADVRHRMQPPGRQRSVYEQVADDFWQLEQPQRVADLGTTATDPSGELLVRAAEVVEQLLVRGCLLERVEL